MTGKTHIAGALALTGALSLICLKPDPSLESGEALLC